MTKMLHRESKVLAIADEIRTKKGSTETYKVSEMANAISSISGTDYTTTLNLTTDKSSTTGAVTLYAEVDNSATVSGLTANGYLETATVTFYKLIDGVRTLLGTNTTTDGIASYTTTITEDTTFVAEYSDNNHYKTCNNTKTVTYDNWRDTYQEVEYIESSGTQYIELDYKHTSDTIAELVMSYNSYSSYTNYDGIIGSRTWYTNNDAFSFFIHNEALTNCTGRYIVDNFCDLAKDTENTLIMSKSNVKLNNVDYPFSCNLTNASSNWYLFGVHQGTSYADSLAQMKVYSLKIYENSTLLLDLVPVYRKSDNEIGMYDLVNDVFYDNDGSGTFEKGEDK